MKRILHVITQLKTRYSWALTTIGFGLALAVIYKLAQWLGEILLMQMLKPQEELRQGVMTGAQDFTTLALGIFVEALPFVILGVLISAFIQVVLPANFITKRLPKNVILRRISLSFAGTAMPVCECGNVPVARSLIARGVAPGDAIVFLLAAPSINIVTFVATWEAFTDNHAMAWLRVAGTFVIANLTAFVVTRLHRGKLLTESFEQTCAHDHRPKRTLEQFVGKFFSEFWLITRLLTIGAMIAAATQIVVPRDIITSIADNPVTAVAAMLALAFVISICSSVDAFFALAFAGTFHPGAILAFLVSGPMVDIKMVALLRSTFTTRVIISICTTVLVSTFLLGLGLVYVW